MQFQRGELQIGALPEKSRAQKAEFGTLHGKVVDDDIAFQIASREKSGSRAAGEPQTSEQASLFEHRTEGRFQLCPIRRRDLQPKPLRPLRRQIVAIASKDGLLRERGGKMSKVESRSTKMCPAFGLLQRNGDSRGSERGIGKLELSGPGGGLQVT